MSFKLAGISDVVTIPAVIPVEDFREEFFHRMRSYLQQSAYIQNVEVSGNSLRFAAPPFRFVWNGWNLFNPVSNGKFEVIGTGKNIFIKYKIWSLEYLFYSLAFSTIAVYGYFPDLFFRLLYLAVIWMLYVFHIFWSANRLEKLIKTMSEKIVEDYLDTFNRDSAGAVI